MKKMACHVKNVAKCLLFLGLCVQIGFGLIWTFQNIGNKTLFAEMQVGISNQHYTIVYVVQLVCAFFAYYTFLSVLRNGKDARWCYAFGALSLLTIPSVLQCHMAVLPYSLMSTALILWFAGVIWYIRKNKTKVMYAVATCVSLLVVHLVCLIPVWMDVETAVSKEEPIFVSMASRVAWPFLQDDYYNMPDEAKSGIDLDVVKQAVVNADGMAQVFYTEISDRYGAEIAKQACLDVVAYELGFNTRKIAEYIIRDLASYHAPAVANALQLEGMGYTTMASRNYACFSMYSPMIANLYVVYWAVSFALFAVATIIIWLLEKRKILWRYVIMFGIPMEYAIFLFTMQGAGLMDYKKVAFVTLITYSVMFLALLPKIEE